jgi:hypothetical protein
MIHVVAYEMKFIAFEKNKYNKKKNVVKYLYEIFIRGILSYIVWVVTMIFASSMHNDNLNGRYHVVDRLIKALYYEMEFVYYLQYWRFIQTNPTRIIFMSWS